jgi:putative transposase
VEWPYLSIKPQTENHHVDSLQFHYLRDLLTKVTRASQPWVATLVRTIFDQPDAAEVHAQFGRVVTALEAKLPAAAAHLSAAEADLLAFTAVPREFWRQVWSSNPQERLNKELRRRTTWWASSPTGPPSSAW